MSFYFSGYLKRISKRGVDKCWFKYKHLYTALEESARNGDTFKFFDYLNVQDIEFLEDEHFTIEVVQLDGNDVYRVSWEK